MIESTWRDKDDRKHLYMCKEKVHTLVGGCFAQNMSQKQTCGSYNAFHKPGEPRNIHHILEFYLKALFK